MEFLDTPIEWSFEMPTPRPGGFDEAVGAAVFGPDHRLECLAEPGALAVTTGQQPGLFTGPLYTIHKALSARGLARILARRWHRPVVPVFWVAGDDHDQREGAGTSWLAIDGTLVSAELPVRSPDEPLRPMYAEPLPSEIDAILDRLAETVPSGEAQAWTIQWLRRHYRPGCSLGDAAGGALAELLGELGVVCIDGSATTLKRKAWPILRRSLAEWPEIVSALQRRSDELATMGRDPGVKVEPSSTLVMLEAKAGRDRLLIDGEGFVTRRSGERFDLAALDRIAAEEPRRLSANVLLRPVVESGLLPTVAYLAGPAELRYLELASALYQPLGVARQLPLPRWSGRWLEPRIGRTAAKLDLTLDQALSPEAEAILAHRATPEELTAAVEDARRSLESGFDRVVAAVASLDPTLEKPARSAASASLNNLAQIEKRAQQAATRKQTEALEQLTRIRTAIAPGGRAQERVIGVAGFLARYGREVLPALAAHIEEWYQAALVAVGPDA